MIDKAVDRARSNGAQLSVIHVDVDLKDLYTEMIDIDIDKL
jgi:universal stress protein A